MIPTEVDAAARYFDAAGVTDEGDGFWTFTRGDTDFTAFRSQSGPYAVVWDNPEGDACTVYVSHTDGVYEMRVLDDKMHLQVSARFRLVDTEVVDES